MFRSNECLSCKYERSKRKVRFEEVIEIVKRTKKVDLLPPKIKKLEHSIKKLRLKKKSLEKEIDGLNDIIQNKTNVVMKKINLEDKIKSNELNGTYWTATTTRRKKISKQQINL